ncbi:uncharacterized protein SPPG_07779 [Spizellomyces punctatus DAOM BR117]|uniref:Uncharacterized protein n=1 Tax=Spizellomyces punctatus (strain DAOM BR117) TaxID=645134 RepID=A0A0L0H8E1_SPIPD|nr:uncharacterized protein SPPG_07779 [Spizellomyces punctatus DAOM BR117]KNC96958.1 hypothetical protein SPPG_07779 [Spizellomyces punctatus DAOM BR117]|eukprot:XP_016604998.1 hypothetical protein SPPG_07779 [Spizellomyces punctatus DAOM BR117]
MATETEQIKAEEPSLVDGHNNFRLFGDKYDSDGSEVWSDFSDNEDHSAAVFMRHPLVKFQPKIELFLESEPFTYPVLVPTSSSETDPSVSSPEKPSLDTFSASSDIPHLSLPAHEPKRRGRPPKSRGGVPTSAAQTEITSTHPAAAETSHSEIRRSARVTEKIKFRERMREHEELMGRWHQQGTSEETSRVLTRKRGRPPKARSDSEPQSRSPKKLKEAKKPGIISDGRKTFPTAVPGQLPPATSSPPEDRSWFSYNRPGELVWAPMNHPASTDMDAKRMWLCQVIARWDTKGQKPLQALSSIVQEKYFDLTPKRPRCKRTSDVLDTLESPSKRAKTEKALPDGETASSTIKNSSTPAASPSSSSLPGPSSQPIFKEPYPIPKQKRPQQPRERTPYAIEPELESIEDVRASYSKGSKGYKGWIWGCLSPEDVKGIGPEDLWEFDHKRTRSSVVDTSSKKRKRKEGSASGKGKGKGVQQFVEQDYQQKKNKADESDESEGKEGKDQELDGGEEASDVSESKISEAGSEVSLLDTIQKEDKREEPGLQPSAAPAAEEAAFLPSSTPGHHYILRLLPHAPLLTLPTPRRLQDANYQGEYYIQCPASKVVPYLSQKPHITDDAVFNRAVTQAISLSTGWAAPDEHHTAERRWTKSPTGFGDVVDIFLNVDVTLKTVKAAKKTKDGAGKVPESSLVAGEGESTATDSEIDSQRVSPIKPGFVETSIKHVRLGAERISVGELIRLVKPFRQRGRPSPITRDPTEVQEQFEYMEVTSITHVHPEQLSSPTGLKKDNDDIPNSTVRLTGKIYVRVDAETNIVLSHIDQRASKWVKTGELRTVDRERVGGRYYEQVYVAGRMPIVEEQTWDGEVRKSKLTRKVAVLKTGR